MKKTSLRATESGVAISGCLTRLLHRFAPRNDGRIQATQHTLKNGASDGNRTRDPQNHNLML